MFLAPSVYGLWQQLAVLEDHHVDGYATDLAASYSFSHLLGQVAVSLRKLWSSTRTVVSTISLTFLGKVFMACLKTWNLAASIQDAFSEVHLALDRR